MKKVIFGSALCLAGTLSLAILFGFLVHAFAVNGHYESVWDILPGSFPVFLLPIALTAAGIILAVLGLSERNPS